MPSFQFKVWRFIIKSQFSKSANTKEININKARRFESPLPPKGATKKCRIKTETFIGRNVFSLSPQKQTDHKRIILFLHGGGYITRITTPYWHFSRKLTNATGHTVIMPDYPVAPENNYQGIINFTVELYKELLKKHRGSRIYLIGDSCGAGLALALSQKLHEASLQQAEKIILLSPWLDLSMSNPEIAELQKNEIMLRPEKLKKTGEMYAAGSDIKNSLLSPVHANMHIFPEMHIFTGTHDILHADAKRFANKAKAEATNACCYEFDKMLHCWMIFPIPEAKAVIEKISLIVTSTSHIPNVAILP